MYCQFCGQQISEDAKFCPHCGAPAGQPAPPAQADQAPPPVQPVQAEPQPAMQYQYAEPAGQPRKKKRGWLIGGIIAVVVIVGLLVAGILTGVLNFTTARLTEAAMAESIDDETMQPRAEKHIFADDTPVIYATALLKNAPEDTLITANWIFATDGEKIASIDLYSTEISQYVCFSLSKPDAGFPAGDYKVELYVEDKLATTLTFSVFATMRLVDPVLSEDVSPETMQPIRLNNTFTSDIPAIYATAFLKNAPKNTLISARWIYTTEDTEFATAETRSTENSQYVAFSVSRPDTGFPVGDYQVELYVDGDLTATLDFSIMAAASLTDAAMASAVDPSSLEPTVVSDVFDAFAPMIYATALLQNAPPDTIVTARWVYLTDGTEIATVDVHSTEETQFVNFTLSCPDDGFPAGDYQVELFLGQELAATLDFSVVAAEEYEVAITSEVDSVTMEPLNPTTVFAVDSPIIYATILLRDKPVGTMVTGEWYYVDDDYYIASVDIESTLTNQYIGFYLTKPTTGFPIGDYEIWLSVDGDMVAVLPFEVR